MIEGGHLAEIYCIFQWKMNKGEGGLKKTSYRGEGLEKIQLWREGVLDLQHPDPPYNFKWNSPYWHWILTCWNDT